MHQLNRRNIKLTAGQIGAMKLQARVVATPTADFIQIAWMDIDSDDSTHTLIGQMVEAVAPRDAENRDTSRKGSIHSSSEQFRKRPELSDRRSTHVSFVIDSQGLVTR
jgi:hypothetical protein